MKDRMTHMKKTQIIIFTLLLLISIDTAIAQSYTVNDIKVDVEGENALDAREKALSQARKKAFDVLTGRIVNSNQRASLPKTTDRSIAMLVESFEINREKQSKNRYLASVNVVFNEQAVQAYVGRHTTVAMPDSAYVNHNTSNVNNNVAMPTSNSADNYAPTGLYQQYQSQRQQSASNYNDYMMQLDVNNIQQWVRVRQQLSSIGQVSLISMNTHQAVVLLSYSGDGAQLQGALRLKGLQLYSSPNSSNTNAPYILVSRG